MFSPLMMTMEHLPLVCLCLVTWSGITSADGNGAAPKASLTTLQTEDGMLLQCVVQGASPKPEVELQDRNGNVVLAEELQVTERGGSYEITLKTTVTKSGIYRCVITQEKIGYLAYTQTFVIIRSNHLDKFITKTRAEMTALALGLGIFAVVMILGAVILLACKYIKKSNGGPAPEPMEHLPLDNRETHDC